MTELNGEAQGKLSEMFRDWQQAKVRLEMAQQTLAGAQADALAKEARFKGAAELIHGKEATFEYSEKGGLKFILPNREQRRAALHKRGAKR